MRARLTAFLALLFSAIPTSAAELVISAADAPVMKAVFGSVEARDAVPARARIGGTVVSLSVEEGSAVAAGDIIALVADDKLALQMQALAARLKAQTSELENAKTELERAEKLLKSGVIAKQKVDALRTQVEVLANQLAATEAERAVLAQQAAEGEVRAPAPGRVLAVPVTLGSVIMPGETVARIAGGGYFLRLSLPERHAARIHAGDPVMVGARGIDAAAADDGLAREGKLVKVYPELSGGRVIADAEVDGLGDFFVGERVLVWIPVASQAAIRIPAAAVSERAGIDYVTLVTKSGPLEAPVIAGPPQPGEGGPVVEILSGLVPGDRIVTP